jgi:hypothetical protein
MFKTDSFEELDETLVPVDFVKNGQITDNVRYFEWHYELSYGINSRFFRST